MTRDKSYRILQLKQGATEQEIRKAFKRLALKVHPDINPDPKAHEEFIQLTKAMETLLKPEKAAKHNEENTSKSKSRATRSEAESEIKARMKEAKMRYEQQKLQKQRENDAYYESLTVGIKWSIFRWIVRIGIGLAILMVLDSFLPSHFENDTLKGYTTVNNNGILFSNISGIQLENEGFHFAEVQRSAWASCYPSVRLETTWFLHTPIAVYHTDDFEVFKTGIDFHLGSIRWYMIVVLLFPLFPYLKRAKKLSFVFMYQFSFWGIGLIELYILLSHNRIGHILSLGFL